MNIYEVLSTPERERILQLLLYLSKPASLYEIAKKANVSPSQVHKYVAILTELGLVKDKLLTDDAIVRSLRLMENIHFIQDMGLVAQIRKTIKGVKGIGIYGSWANGTNDENADIDIWIITDFMIDDLSMGRTRRELENKLKRKVDIAIIPPGKLKELKDKNPTFYFSLYHSIKLWGEEIWQ